jgi:hypothetical protein
MQLQSPFAPVADGEAILDFDMVRQLRNAARREGLFRV